MQPPPENPRASESIDMLAPQVRANPFPTYESLRQHPPRPVEPAGVWAVARYRDVQYVLKNSHLFISSAFQRMLEPDWIPRNPMADSLLALDPPEHTKLRALANRGFTTAAIASLRPRIDALAEELVEGLVQRADEVDFVAAMGAVMPARIIAELIGIDQGQHQSIKRWSNALASITPAPPTEEQLRTVVPCIEEMSAHLGEVIQARRQKPQDDMVSRLVQSEIDGRQLTDRELLGLLFILVPAGFETTSHLLSSAALRFSQHPDELALLRAKPDRVPAYVEELLRYQPSVHGVLRLSTADVELGGVTIPGGSMVLALLGAANRDPDRFPDPDVFDINRNPTAHMSLGHGIHFCLGAPLARMEAASAIAAMSRKLARVELARDTALAWNRSLTIRGLMRLPLRCTAT